MYLLSALLCQVLEVKVKVTQSCQTLCDPMDCPWNSPDQNTGGGSLSFLQGIFPTQGLICIHMMQNLCSLCPLLQMMKVLNLHSFYRNEYYK